MFINRGLIHPQMHRAAVEVEADTTTDEIDCGAWDDVHLFVSGANGMSCDIEIQGRVSCHLEDGTEVEAWLKVWSDTGLAPDPTSPPAPENPEEPEPPLTTLPAESIFVSQLTSVPVQPYDKLRFVLTNVSGPISVWAGGGVSHKTFAKA